LTPVSPIPARLNNPLKATVSQVAQPAEPLGVFEEQELLPEPRTPEQQKYLNALREAYASWERALANALPRIWPDVLKNSLLELYPLAKRANVPHVEVGDWATLQGQVYGIDDDALQKHIVEAKAQSDAGARSGQPPSELLPKTGANPVLVRVSDVNAKPIRWLWQDRIAYGKLSIIAGDLGLGKSQLTMHLAAAVTKGGTHWWPDCADNVEPANVIILSAEDDIADTIRPRLEAAGAELDRVTVLTAIMKEDGAGERGVNIGEDTQHIERAIKRVGNVGLIIIDPVSAYLGRMSGNNNVEVRFALAPVQALAMKYGAAVVAVSHLNKPNAGGSTALNRVTGSGAFSAAARPYFWSSPNRIPNKNFFCPAKLMLAVRKMGSRSKSRSATRRPVLELRQFGGLGSPSV